jgi:hypothetical protein
MAWSRSSITVKTVLRLILRKSTLQHVASTHWYYGSFWKHGLTVQKL